MPEDSASKTEFGKLRTRYAKVRTDVKDTIQTSLHSGSKPNQISALRKGAFLATEKKQEELDESERKRKEAEEMQKEAEATAMTDALTGIKSRAWFNTAIEEHTARASRTENPLYLVIIDFDRFKDFNDAFGHVTGDDVLKLIGKIKTRTDEPMARYGGDEFVLLIDREFSEKEIITMTTRFENQITEESSNILRDVPILPKSEVKIPPRVATLSFGITRYVLGESSEQFRMRADMALYHVKSSGRNSCAMAIPEDNGSVTVKDIPSKSL